MGKIYKNGIEYGGGGGSAAGGHTILDNDGNTMPTEDNLQFKGLDVTDNSTDGVTEVESTGLNQDSMDDVLSASASGVQVASNGMSYSTEEQVVGRWIDGKPLYQKTVTISSDSYDLSSLNIEHIHLANMVTNDTGSIRLFDSWYYSDTDFFRLVYANDALLKQKGASGTMPEVIATIQYTKTTD